MSVSVETLQDAVKRRNVAAPLSQSVVAGIVGVLDISAVAISGLAMVGALERVKSAAAELAAIALCALLVVLGLHAAGSYGFRVIMNPARRAPVIAAVCGLVFLVLIALAFAFKISSDISRLWAFTWMIGMIVLILGFRGIAA